MRIDSSNCHRHILLAPRKLIVGSASLDLLKEVPHEGVPRRANPNVLLREKLEWVQRHLVQRKLRAGTPLLCPHVHADGADLRVETCRRCEQEVPCSTRGVAHVV